MSDHLADLLEACRQAPQLVWNRPPEVSAAAVRYQGGTHAVEILWPDPFRQARVTVQGS